MDGGPEWAVNDRLWARDRCYAWYESTVVAEDGDGDQRMLKIHFNGWNDRHNEQIRAKSRRLRAEPPESDESEADDSEESDVEDDREGHVKGSQFAVEKLLAKKLIDGDIWYKIRWQGYSSKRDEWQNHSCIHDDLIDEFEARRAAEQPASRSTRARQPPAPKVAFSLSAENPLLEQRAQMRALARPWLVKLFRRAAKILAKTKQPRARRALLSGQVCPAWLFVAIYDTLTQDAANCAGTPADHLTAVKPLKGQGGGELVQDTFSIKSHDLIKQLLAPYRIGAGAGSMVYLDNKTSVGMLAPIKFILTTRRSSPDPELTVTANFGTLVNAAGARYEPTFRFGNVSATDATRKVWEIALSADLLAHAGSGARVPKRLVKWVRARMQAYAAAAP
jgi:hypothetical protein